MLRVAVLGCGRIGRMHAQNLAAHPRAALAGVYDIAVEAADAVSSALGVRSFAAAAEIFADPAVDAVLIATSTATHVDFLKAAVVAGKAVLCEKPIDLSLARVDDCARAIAHATVPIMIGFCRRFDPGHRAARQAMRDGEIGDLHQVVITSRDPGLAPSAYIEVSGGIFRDMTIHDFDMARYMLGEEIATVTAHGSRLVDPALMQRCNDFDTVMVTLVSYSGKQAVIINSREAAYGYDQRVELFGAKGMLISENHRENLVTKHVRHATGVSAPLQNFFIERYKAAFAAEIDNFVDAIEGKAPLAVDFDDGRKASVLAEAAVISVRDGRTVPVSEIG